jgi:hypothetical protein
MVSGTRLETSRAMLSYRGSRPTAGHRTHYQRVVPAGGRRIAQTHTEPLQQPQGVDLAVSFAGTVMS